MPAPVSALRSASRRCWLNTLGALATLGPAAVTRAQPRPAAPLRLGGTGAGLGVLQQLFDGQASFRFVPNLGTGGGLKALAAGAIDLVLAARPLTDAERASGMVELELFRTPLVWAVQAAVATQRVTTAELVALYAGRTARWTGGEPVRLVLRPESDTDTRYMKAMSAAMADALTLAHTRPGAHVAVTDMDATEALERTPGALGVSTLGLLRAQDRRVRVLELDGVVPDVQTLAAGRWPHVRTVTLVMRGQPPVAVAEAITTLRSTATARGLAALGCVASGGR